MKRGRPSFDSATPPLANETTPRPIQSYRSRSWTFLSASPCQLPDLVRMGSKRSANAHRYEGRPYACGVLGAVAPDTVQRLLDLSPPVRKVQAEHLRGELWTTTGGRWNQRETYNLGSGQSEPHPWLQVANADHPGLAVTSEGIRLFSGATGLGALYFRQFGSGVAFSSEPDPLIDLGAVSTNWKAWIDILTLGHPQGASSTVEQVSRIEPASSVVLDDDVVRVQPYDPYWARVEQAEVSPPEVVDHLHAAMPRFTHPSVTLSGGWDSRLLACLIRQHSSRPFDAWTIAADDGFDQDLDLAGPVAESLGANHSTRQQPEHLEPIEASYRLRVFYETWFHTWLEPLASELRLLRRQVLDGLGGDVLFKNLFVSAACVREPDPNQQLELVWESLTVNSSTNDPNVWGSQFLEAARSSRERFDESIRHHVIGHDVAPTLAVLMTRSVRGIAPSPMWLFGPECDVATPFVARPVVEAALRIPLEEKVDGRFYRLLLEAVAPEVAAFPSTNDTPKPPPRERRSLSPMNIAAYSRSIVGSPDAMRLLPQALAYLVREPHQLAVDPRRGSWLKVLKGASLLSEWQHRWQHRLTDIGQAPW